MTIKFYAVESEYTNVVGQLVKKLYSLNKKCLILCNSEEEVTLLDSKLWTISRLSFIPHSSTDVSIAKYCHTWISTHYSFYNSPTCLINLTFNIEMISKFTELMFVFHRNELEQAKELINNMQIQNYILWQQHQGGWTQIT